MQKSVYTIDLQWKNSDDQEKIQMILIDLQMYYYFNYLSIKITFLSFYNTKTSTKIIRQLLYFINFHL